MSFQQIVILIIVLFLVVVAFFFRGNLLRFCILTPIKNLILCILLSAILWALSTTFVSYDDWHTKFEPGNIEMFVYPFIINITCCMVSFSIIVNLIRKVRDNVWLSLMSFFLLPILVVLYYIVVPYTDSDKQVTSFTAFLPVFYSLAFFIPQIYFFFRFRYIFKHLKETYIMYKDSEEA